MADTRLVGSVTVDDLVAAIKGPSGTSLFENKNLVLVPQPAPVKKPWIDFVTPAMLIMISDPVERAKYTSLPLDVLIALWQSLPDLEIPVRK